MSYLPARKTLRPSYEEEWPKGSKGVEMANAYPSIILLIILLLSPNAKAADIEELLSTQAEWISIPYSKSPFVRGIQILDPPKKWSVTRDERGMLIRELSANSLRFNKTAPECFIKESLTEPNTIMKSVELQQLSFRPNEISSALFESNIEALLSNRLCSSTSTELEKYELKIIAEGLFRIDFRKSKKSVLFVPVDRSAKALNIPTTPVRKRTQVLRAPLGQFEEPFSIQFSLTPRPTVYLHHDLTKTRKVLIDQSFPEHFRDSIRSAIAEWNFSIGFDYFKIEETSQNVDIDGCLSGDVLCFAWDGPAIVTVRHMSCGNSNSFDPISGQILGGLIYCWSPANENTQPLDNDSKKVLDAARFSPQGMREYWKLSDDALSNRIHPRPLEVLQYLLIHEIGHFFGFSHNFLASTVSTFRSPFPSIMEYYPVSLISRESGRLGRFDLAMLAHIYRGQAIDESYLFCSDAEANPKALYPTFNLKKIAACNQFDFGDSLDWMWDKMMAQGGPGMETEDIYGIKRLAIDDIIPFLDGEYSERASNMICSLQPIEKELGDYLTKQDISIRCQ